MSVFKLRTGLCCLAGLLLTAQAASGQIQFSAPQTLDQPHNFPEVIRYDVDQDGDMDFVADGGYDPFVGPSWLENQGNRSLVNHPISPGDVTRHKVAGDLDGDGDTDIVACNSSDGIFWYQNVSDAMAFTRHVVDDSFGMGCRALGLGDFNGDGYTDIMVVGDGVQLFQNQDGTGTQWSASQDVYENVPTRRVHTADMDNDGDIDAVFTRSDTRLILLKNNAGTLEGSEIHSMSNEIVVIRLTDINQDGYMDILLSDEGSLQLLQNYQGLSFTPSTVVPSTGSQMLNSVDVADFDDDGDLDIVITHHYDSGFVENNGSGWEEEQVAYPGNNSFNEYRAYTADLDGDGLKDIVHFPYRGDDGHYVPWIRNDTLGPVPEDGGTETDGGTEPDGGSQTDDGGTTTDSGSTEEEDSGGLCTTSPSGGRLSAALFSLLLLGLWRRRTSPNRPR